MIATREDRRWRERPRIAYCASCPREERESTYEVGTILRCPDEPRTRIPPHHARVVSGEAGKLWARIEWRADRYAQSRAIHWRFPAFDDNVGSYVSIACLFLVGALWSVGSWDPAGSLLLWHFSVPALWLWRSGWVMLALASAADSLIVNTAIAFVSRRPVGALRSATFGVAGVAHLTLTFAIAYASLREGFNRTMDWLDCWYFSSVTMSTLGFGDIHPDPTKAGKAALSFGLLRGIIVLELIIGLYFLAVILTVVVSWANARNPWARPDPMEFPSQRPDAASEVRPA